MDHQPGDIIHQRYRIICSIGKGGFGETYQAEDTQSPGLVCVVKYLKPLDNEPLKLQIAEEKFRQEADILRRLGTYNQQIPQLYNYFQENQKFYLVQEYIEGQNLKEEIKNQLLSEKQVIDVLYDVLKVLDYLSGNNVIHRDIKPDNLIRRTSDNKIFLIDFGAVKEVSVLSVNPEGQTVLTMVIGTRGYMPQEQLIGKPKFASDIHALGVTGFVLLTGRIPVKNQKDEIIWNGVQISPYLATILDKMVRFDYQQRYETAAEVLADLKPLTLLDQTLNQRYYIKSYLGGGGLSYTYLAEDSQRPYQTDCIIKQLQLPGKNQQILQSAQSLFATAITESQNFPHQQIPRLLDHFQKNQEFYLVYEFIEGEALSRKITPGNRLSEPEVIALLKDVLEILAFIHHSGIIHGDIKPSNLIRRQRDNKIVLIDFSKCKQITTLEINPQRIVVVKPGGTHGYMPAEQLQNKLNPCSDIYALGLTAIQALTGVSPEQLRTDSQGEFVWRNRAKVSPKLARILTKMVRFQFGQRYQSAQEVLKALNPPNLLNFLQSRQSFRLLPIFVLVGVVSIGLIFYKKLRNDRIEEFFNTGKSLENKEKYEEAIKAYEQAIALDPNFIEALVNKGYALGKLNRNEEKLNACTEATQRDKNSFEAWLCKANAESDLGQYPESMESVEMAKDLSCKLTKKNYVNDCSNAWNSQGLTLMRLKQPDKALIAFNTAIEKNSKNHVAWTNKGDLLTKNSPQEARKAYEEALRIKSDYEPAQNGIRDLGG
ncbi:protein kinase [Hassallia byssoidea VB512170]|uniref:non-specific serine/threonine protein kinase n=1 Tax=Hassallia byssoidea VB512170 TaxID=1304833 RepID=A0A846HBP7_9CYAN|nr:serine/threonine-protein kinase [Hassalia byssoidea]NEU74473.1 protein kinase [Hassalia byssoidea VB512170]